MDLGVYCLLMLRRQQGGQGRSPGLVKGLLFYAAHFFIVFLDEDLMLLGKGLSYGSHEALDLAHESFND